jgi:hypothetical protein
MDVFNQAVGHLVRVISPLQYDTEVVSRVSSDHDLSSISTHHPNQLIAFGLSKQLLRHLLPFLPV